MKGQRDMARICKHEKRVRQVDGCELVCLKYTDERD